MKQAKAKGIKVPFIGGDGWDSAELFKIAGTAANGNYFSNHYSHEEQRPEVQNFVANYKKKWGSTPDGLAALGYDAARVLFDAMDRAASLDGKTLSAAINSTKDFAGVTGKITIDEKRNAQKKAVILKIENNAAHLVTDIWPPGMEPGKPADGSGGAGSGGGSGSGSAATGEGGGSAALGGATDDGAKTMADPGAASGGAKGDKDEAAKDPAVKTAPPKRSGTKADPDEGGE
jgi:hypothetical protein